MPRTVTAGGSGANVMAATDGEIGGAIAKPNE